jgi:hypothetical protein
MWKVMNLGWTSKKDQRSEKSGGDKIVKGMKDEDTKKNAWLKSHSEEAC